MAYDLVQQVTQTKLQYFWVLEVVSHDENMTKTHTVKLALTLRLSLNQRCLSNRMNSRESQKILPEKHLYVKPSSNTNKQKII